MTAPKAIIAPSMLSCDFSFLANEANRMCKCGADWLHMDVMTSQDGYPAHLKTDADIRSHFVPNITLGAPVIKSLRQHTNAFLDCHMMVAKPEQWVTDFKNAGASQYTFHMEATTLVKQIKEAGMKVGVGIKPKTSMEEAIRRIEPVVDQVDMILVMTVEPGFGGQSFMEDMMPKVTAIRQRFPKMNIQVDGGLASDTVHKAAAAGANVIVAGTSVFKAPDPAKMIEELRSAVDVRAKH